MARFRATPIWEQLVTVRHPDPSQVRRGRLLSILLLGTGVASLAGVIVAVIISLARGWDLEGLNLIACGIVLLVLVAGLYVVNRRVSPRAAAVLFLASLLLLLAFGDEPDQLVGGRSNMLFAVPIIMASVVLFPPASFLVAGLVNLILGAVAAAYLPPAAFSPISVIGFFLIALVGWLAANNLENALDQLRTINQELDQRVEERTREVAEALGRNRAILEGIADGVVVFDNSGRATTANPAMEGLLRQPSWEIVGRGLDDLMAGQVTERDRAAVARLLGDRETSYPALQFEWGEKTLSASFAPVRDDRGTVSGTVAVFRDFTREAEIDRMKSAFVSMVSHELRTPLSAILGYADMLREGVYGQLSDKQILTVQRIVANTGRLLAIVNDLLDQAQIEAGRLRLNVTSFAPAQLVEGVLSLTAAAAHDKGLELTSSIADEVPATLSGDPQRLHQILLNLVSNAVKFTARGKVEVHIRRPDEDHWAMEVSDTGCGIPEEARAYIFEPFRRADESTTRKQVGFGLGLSIVRRLTDLMGGEVNLESAVNQGSTFTIVLPLEPTQEDAS